MIQVREYGTAGPWVVTVHGGPGAMGSMAPVARGLAGRFRVLEPWQRRSGGDPLTVARHVADLHEVMQAHCTGQRPAIVGHSWGAMLTLAYAATHPEDAGPLVLVGCGTFDLAARARMNMIRQARMGEDLFAQMARIEQEIADPDECLCALGRLMMIVDSYELGSTETGMEVCDAAANRETWDDMLHLQEMGVYPAAFVAIRAPVLMVHGAHDPHPGDMIRASLAPCLPQIEYHEWARCGHYPWLERAVGAEFFAVVGTWLQQHLVDRAG
ncbi:MAG: alpha/beta hydrolase [Anaerolineae bacterium]|nr:alpha/beta hydrolase [Anaerolineae bacterium]